MQAQQKCTYFDGRRLFTPLATSRGFGRICLLRDMLPRCHSPLRNGLRLPPDREASLFTSLRSYIYDAASSPPGLRSLAVVSPQFRASRRFYSPDYAHYAIRPGRFRFGWSIGSTQEPGAPGRLNRRATFRGISIAYMSISPLSPPAAARPTAASACNAASRRVDAPS